MKKLLLLLALSLAYLTCFAQNKEFKLKDYQWLHELESEENIKWVDTKKEEGLAFFNSIDLLSDLEQWKKEYTAKKKPNFLARVQPDAYQVGEFVENISGKTLLRMKFEAYNQGGARPNMVNIQELNLPLNGNLLFDEAISQAPEHTRSLIFYKKSGRRVLRAVAELDWNSKQLVEDGFQLAPAETQIQWRDQNSVYVNTNLEKPLEYGYKLRVWKRGEPIEKARVLFETKIHKAGLILSKKGNHLFLTEQLKAFDERHYLLKDDKLHQLNLPKDIKNMMFVGGQFVVHLRSAWKPDQVEFSPGSLISINFDDLLNGKTNFSLIADSTQSLVMDHAWNTNDILIVRALENVQSVLFEYTYSDGKWSSKRIANPMGNQLTVIATQEPANRYYLEYRSFFERARIVRQPNGDFIKYVERNEPVNKDDYVVSQQFASSKDGAKVPYYIIHKKGLVMNNNNPVLMTGYGGWGRSILPSMLNQYVRWLDDGGVYVLANIRGGGEFGPQWHEAGRKGNRQNAYDDFKAVAEDLIEQKVTKAGLIGSHGGSNGGLLVANAFIQNPGLFGAVVIRSGSIDLELAGTGGGRGIGALGERGDPEIKEEWAYMKKISPLHTLKGGENYPPILQFTSRNDDVSHCAKSRKFHQRLIDLGYTDNYLFETAGGGHGYTDMPNQQEIELAFFYKYLHPNYDELNKTD